MSSRNRRNRGEATDDILGDLGSNEASSPFEGLESVTASDIADAAYASGVGHDDPFAKLGRNREKIHLTQIDAIVPNPAQPRRAIPSGIRQYWSGKSDEDAMGLFFQRWLEEVNLERRGMGINETFPLDDLLISEPTNRTKGIDQEEKLEQISAERVGPKEITLLRVVDLAASIHRDGLINPISIAQNGRLWEIETGERRWLAYQLLNWRFVGDDYLKIPARQVEGISIWRQATENNVRADLNAIATARQFALLLMDLRTELSDDHFQPMTEFENEQDFYAQVSNGNKFSVPYGMGEKLINAMGISHVGQLRHIRRLLRLPQIVWTIADDLNWTENFIQKKLMGDDDNTTIRNAILQAKRDGMSSSLFDDYQDLLSDDTKTKTSKRKLGISDFQDKVLSKVESEFTKLNKSDKKKAIEILEELLIGLKEQT